MHAQVLKKVNKSKIARVMSVEPSFEQCLPQELGRLTKIFRRLSTEQQKNALKLVRENGLKWLKSRELAKNSRRD